MSLTLTQPAPRADGGAPSVITAAQLGRFGKVVRERLGHGRLDGRPELLERRLRAACARFGSDVEGLFAALDGAQEVADDAPAALAVAEAITNHETSFFRDAAQLRAVVEVLAAPRAAQAEPSTEVRLLSVGCATGEEVYSLAMFAQEALHLSFGRRLEVWGVDVSPESIATARRGHYPEGALLRAGEGPTGWTERFFRRGHGAIWVRPHLVSATRFEVGNLMRPASLTPLRRFAVVVCRNVLIYFDPESLWTALESLWALVAPGGALALGPSEVAAAEPHLGPARREGGLFWFERGES